MFKKLTGLVLVATLIVGAFIAFAPAQHTEAGGGGVEADTCRFLRLYKDMCDAGDAWGCWAYESITEYAASKGWCQAGADMAPLSSAAVVGEFTTNTELLLSPGGLGSGTVMEIGKTVWVLGVDASGMYYKVLLSGQAGWVPVSSMGPNFDEVWNGAPLPTTVVD